MPSSFAVVGIHNEGSPCQGNSPIRLTVQASRELLAFRDGALPDERFSELEHHLASCETCVTTLTTVDPTPAYVDSDIVTDDENFASESECQAAMQFISRIPNRCVEDIPSHIANYRLERQLGCGGMGVVYKAWQDGLDRPVVVKLLQSYRLSSQTAVEQFKQELRAVGKLKHPNIVQAYDGGSFDGQPYFGHGIFRR